VVASVAVFWLAHIPFISEPRYRIPVAPLLQVLEAAGCVLAVDWLTAHLPRPWGLRRHKADGLPVLGPDGVLAGVVPAGPAPVATVSASRAGARAAAGPLAATERAAERFGAALPSGGDEHVGTPA
jgi:hypothetical protein